MLGSNKISRISRNSRISLRAILRGIWCRFRIVWSRGWSRLPVRSLADVDVHVHRWSTCGSCADEDRSAAHRIPWGQSSRVQPGNGNPEKPRHRNPQLDRANRTDSSLCWRPIHRDNGPEWADRTRSWWMLRTWSCHLVRSSRIDGDSARWRWPVGHVFDLRRQKEEPGHTDRSLSFPPQRRCHHGTVWIHQHCHGIPRRHRIAHGRRSCHSPPDTWLMELMERLRLSN